VPECGMIHAPSVPEEEPGYREMSDGWRISPLLCAYCMTPSGKLTLLEQGSRIPTKW